MTDLQSAIKRLWLFNAMTAPQYVPQVEGDFDDDLTTILDALENANTTLAEDLRYQRRLEAKLARIEEQPSAEFVWRDGYFTGKRDYAGSITGGRPISTPNPYSKEQSA